MAFVSVVIPLYNKRDDIAQAIRSVLAQSHADFELIVVNDASTDGGAEKARGFSDARVRVIDLDRRGGAAAARNAGINAARYSLIAFLDADDVWYPHFLETALSLYERFPQAGLFGTAYDIASGGRIRGANIKGMPRGFEGVLKDYFNTVTGRMPVISSAVMVPRAVFERLGGFADNHRLGEDQDMWCRIALAYPVAYSMRRCAAYRIDAANSICRDSTVTEPYPVILTVERALKSGMGPCGRLKKYLSKLYIDYAVHLIRGFEMSGARAALKNAGWRIIRDRLRAEYYYMRTRLKMRRSDVILLL